jgi:tetratricopeptide (TPR) repeat protein
MEQVVVGGATVRIPDGIVARPRRFWGARPADTVLRLLREGALTEADELLRKIVAGTGVSGDWWFLAAETARALDATERAVVAYEKALEQRPDAPTFWWARLGSAALAAGDSTRAVEAYERAVAGPEDAPAAWNRDLAKAYAACGRTDDAVAAFTKVVDGQRNPPERVTMELVRYLNRAGRKGEARQRVEQMLDQDPGTRPLDRLMAANNTEFFGIRRKVLHFVEDHLTEIRAAAGESLLQGGTDRRTTLWTYWAQGWDDVPEVVAMCRRRLRDLAGSDVVALDLDSVTALVQIPADLAGLELGHAHRSDLLRLELLGRFGGTWIDSTCFVTEDPRPHLARLAKDGFFAFEKAGSTLANWLISCEPDNYLVRMTRSALHAYLREHKEWSYYFLFHYVFESLVLCDEEFGRLWAASPRRKLGAPNAFMRHRAEPVDQLDLEALFGESFVQKLSYRYIDDALKIPGSFMNHLLATA